MPPSRHPRTDRCSGRVHVPLHTFVAAFVSLSWAAVAVAQAPVQYSLDEAGRVSVAVYDTQGRQVRTLSSGAAQDAGRHTLTWDGLDWTGQPAPAGEYEWRLLSGPGLKSEFLLKVGTPLRELPWPNNHNGPYQMAVCGDLLFIKGSGEVVPAQVAVDLRDGTPLHYRGMNGDVLAGGPGRLATLGHNGVQLHTLVENVPTKATERDVHVHVARHEVPPVSELERVAEKKPVEVDEVTEGMLDELNPVTQKPNLRIGVIHGGRSGQALQPSDLLKSLLPHFDEFDQEVELGVGRNHRRSAAGTVAQFAGDQKFDHAAVAHQLHPFGPSWDHTTEWKFDRFASLVRAVKNLAVVEPAVVVHFHGVGGFGAGTRAFAKHAVLQTGRRGGKYSRSIGVDLAGTGGELRVEHFGWGGRHGILQKKGEGKEGNA